MNSRLTRYLACFILALGGTVSANDPFRAECTKKCSSCQSGSCEPEDPIEERGGVNLYECVGNETINVIDPHGLRELAFENNAFIPGRLGKWLPEPPFGLSIDPNYTLSQFKSDERSFGGGSSRLRIEMSFPSESIGELDRQDISFKVNGDGSHRRRWKVPFWPIGGKAHYWEYEFKPHENTGEITNIKNYFDNGNNKCSEITLKASGKYPFLPVAPEIDIESTIWACRCYNSKSSIPSGFATISEYVVHNSFPNYEASIDGSWIYSYDTTGTGPNLFNLGLNVVNASFGVSVIVD